MTEREALLQAVYAHPAADLPRLVLADWCDERGEVERAELIRLQVEILRRGTRPELTDRLADLLHQFGRLLDPPDRDTFERIPTRPMFDRGFLCGVAFDEFGDWPPAAGHTPPAVVEAVAASWHAVCDLAERHPLFTHAECPDWFALSTSRDAAGRWVPDLQFWTTRWCRLCEGDGWLNPAARLAPTRGEVEAVNPWRSGQFRWRLGRLLFGHDHPHFQGDRGG